MSAQNSRLSKASNEVVIGTKRERGTTGSEVGKRSGKGYEEQEFNM